MRRQWRPRRVHDPPLSPTRTGHARSPATAVLGLVQDERPEADGDNEAARQGVDAEGHAGGAAR